MRVKKLKNIKINSTGNKFTPPHPGCIEVSLFGPGYGESILIHYGNNKWIIVDSCIKSGSSKPAPIEYLYSIGVSPEKDVSCVIASHFHDDHIRGLSTIVETCKNAKFYCSDALRNDEFLNLVSLYGDRDSLMESTGIDEFNKILQSLIRQNKCPNWVLQDSIIHKNTVKIHGKKQVVEIAALSPSARVNLKSKLNFEKLLPEAMSSKRAIVLEGKNNYSVVVLLRIGSVSCLLGSDLEMTSETDTGWEGVIRNSEVIDIESTIFKIPHHGSESSDHPGIWKKLLIKDPLSILTPFRRGNVILPTMKDIDRINTRTKHAFITSNPLMVSEPKSSGALRRTIKECVKNIGYYNPKYGQIRVRSDIVDSSIIWNVELFDPAIEMNKVMKNLVAQSLENKANYM